MVAYNAFCCDVHRQEAAMTARGVAAKAVDGQRSDAKPAKREPLKRLMHICQRCPVDCSIERAHVIARSILKIRGVRPGGRYYFEQTGITDEELGKGMHLHLVCYAALYKSQLLQRIVSKAFTEPNLTFVVQHDDFAALHRYLNGDKGPEKAQKVAGDSRWRTLHGLEVSYGV